MRRLLLSFLATLTLISVAQDRVLAAQVTYTIITADKIKVPTQYIERAIKGVLGDAQPREVDWRTPEAQAWIKKLDIQFIPYVIFNKSIHDSDKFFDLAKNGMIERKQGEYVIPDGMLLPAGVMFFKYKAQPGQVDLFIMADCPGGKEAVKFLDKYFADNPKAFRLNIHYLATFDEFGITAQHGKGELRENINQLIIRKYYPGKFFKYHELYRQNGNFEAAAKQVGIEPAKIKAKTKEGIELLRKDVELAKRYGVASSPTFVWEGQVIFLGLDPFERFLAFNALDKIVSTDPEAPARAARGTVPRN